MKRFALLFAALLMFASGFFTAMIPREPQVAQAAAKFGMETTSSIFVLLLALPSFLALLRWLGWRQGVLCLFVLGAFAIGIETLAVYTGFPYGQFAHGEKIGAKLFGAVPWTVPFAWTPLVLAALALASRARAKMKASFPGVAVLLTGALVLVAIDLLLDPAAVAQGFWEYKYPSAYYGVPLSNFAGWLVSGFIGCALLARLSRWDGSTPLPAGLMTSGFLIFVFWSSAAIWMGLVFPAMIGIVLTTLSGYFVFRREPLT